MWTIGPIAFAAPLVLIALLTLPILWRVLRATPPPPKRAIFPPLRLLKDAPDDAETPHHAPWWLILFRLLLAAIVIIALARPIWQPEDIDTTPRPLLLVVDDGWASTPGWSAMKREAERALARADSAGQPSALVFTAASSAGDEIRLSDSGAVRRRLESAQTQAWPPNRIQAADRIQAAADAGALDSNLDIVWLSDGVTTTGAEDLARTLSSLGRVDAMTPLPGRNALALGPPAIEPDGFAVTVYRSEASLGRDVSLVATGSDGRALARASVTLDAGVRSARTDIALPLDLRNRVTNVRIEDQSSAGAIQLTGDAWRRARVGVIDAPSEDGQPLLSDLHYVTRALEPFSELRRDNLDELLISEPSVLVMVDAARTDDPRITEFVENGGLLIRFAGPRLAARGDDLLPVDLREGGRLFGGAMAWENPQRMAPFAPDSPFAGLTANPDAVISRQVLAQPGSATDDRVWARLDDGTPLVTAARRGRGWIVLYHVTAGPEWSELPLTGLYPRMLRRTLGLAGGAGAPRAQSGRYAIESALDGQGRLVSPPPSAQAVPAELWDTTRASPQTPPGLYQLGSAGAALNVMQAGDTLDPLPDTLAGVRFAALETARETHLIGSLLALALVLLIVDAVIALALAGRIPNLSVFKGPAAAMLALAIAMPFAPRADAQEFRDSFALEAALEMRFAYIRTGNATLDARSDAGLRGLTAAVSGRSAIEPAPPMGINIESDEVVFFPLIYWPITNDAPPLSPQAAARVSAYLQTGGLIIFDTQDANLAATRAGAPHPGLARVLDSVDVPSLAPIPADHVLTRTFYLLQDFPGRWSGGQVWVEADPDGAARDGASGVVIGSNDWASAWAVSASGDVLSSVEGGERQREMARRFGVNLAMYALTGNYKADQVHVPALLERLGQ